MPWALESSTYSTKLLVVRTMLLPMATYILCTPSTSLVCLCQLNIENGGKYTYNIHEVYIYTYYVYLIWLRVSLAWYRKCQLCATQELRSTHCAARGPIPATTVLHSMSSMHTLIHCKFSTDIWPAAILLHCALRLMHPTSKSTTARSEQWYLTRFYHLLLPPKSWKLLLSNYV